MTIEDFSRILSFSYGEGEYVRGAYHYEGQIVLSGHKLYLKNAHGEITDTFIPLEKIYKVKAGFWGRIVWFYVRPSQFMQFEAMIKGDPRQIRALIKDLVNHRQLRKKGWLREWVDPEMI